MNFGIKKAVSFSDVSLLERKETCHNQVYKLVTCYNSTGENFNFHKQYLMACNDILTWLFPLHFVFPTLLMNISQSHKHTTNLWDVS